MATTTSLRQHSLCQPCSECGYAQLKGTQRIRSARRGPRVRLAPAQAGFGDAIRDLFDFEKWAPRSSQAWRLGQEPVVRNPAKASNAAETSITEDDVEILNQRITSSRQSMGSMDLLGQAEQLQDDIMAMGGDASDNFDSTAPSSETPSFLQSTDAELSDALNSRITQMKTTTSPSEESTSESIGAASSSSSREMLTGPALAELVYNKYEKWHDVGIVRRDIPGKTLVTLNVYHAHLGQRSFPMTEEEFKEKMDGVAALLEIWGKAEVIIDFMNSPVAPRRGLPSRPIVGNAVAIPLDLSNEQIAEWFAR
ncbi:hypothetical protein Ndes2526B_g05569 [Nannochloris sp. 'desiccata']|nr:hypothetical protein KSW81_007427 [Chlorella desiccata (nom. nud.)]KAH7618655.1 hypothetical protein NADE_005504 [Chlorella desiccata (nom. nud.)]